VQFSATILGLSFVGETKMNQTKIFVRQSRIFFIFFLLFILIPALNVEGAYLRNFPVTVVQPSGEKLEVFASGDEFYNWLHDKDGFTIIKDPDTGYYVYATEKNGELLSSGYTVNQIDPRDFGIDKYLKQAPEKRKAPAELFPYGSPANVDQINTAPKTGTINNIVVFIRFSDESEFTDTVSNYDTMFNNNTPAANSMLNYFDEVSYNQLNVSTTFYPIPPSSTVVSYQDSHPRAYYQPYDATTNPIGYSGDTDRTNREHILLKNAVDAISSAIPGTLNVDGDEDGLVDNVCFIIYGGPTGWNSLLWPHQWSLYSQVAYINGKRVFTYNFQLQTSLASSGVGVLCHEMFHSLGAPDLYHYTDDGFQPVYKWDIMEWDLNPPQHMGAYMKFRYGAWISSIPEITSDGTYSLNPLTSPTNNCYKIASPCSPDEYFLVEHRRQTGTFESSLPGEGLLVYRINMTMDGEGNRDGPPDEVYIYRPDGTTSENGSPALANFSQEVGRTNINDSTNPSSFLSNGKSGGLDISNIGSSGETISFDVILTTADVCETPPECNVQDGGFEAGTPNPYWDETSTNFGTPLCTVAICGTGLGTGPHSEYWWAWFGGTPLGEASSVEQSVPIPAGTSATLDFYLEIPVANTAGYMRAYVDGTQLFEATQADAASYATYKLVTLDVSAYADGAVHVIRFDSSIDAGEVTNFFVDDICLTVEGSGPTMRKNLSWLLLLLGP
jgi:M6 family metalloprotease-like protein